MNTKYSISNNTYKIEMSWDDYYLLQISRGKYWVRDIPIPNIQISGTSIYENHHCGYSLNLFSRLLAASICIEYVPEEDPYVIFEAVKLPYRATDVIQTGLAFYEHCGMISS